MEEAAVEDAEQRQEQTREEEKAETGDARPTDLASQEQEKVEEAAAARGRGKECAICLIEVRSCQRQEAGHARLFLLHCVRAIVSSRLYQPTPPPVWFAGGCGP